MVIIRSVDCELANQCNGCVRLV